MKNVLKPLPKSILIPLGLTVQHHQQTQEYMKNSEDHDTSRHSVSFGIITANNIFVQRS